MEKKATTSAKTAAKKNSAKKASKKPAKPRKKHELLIVEDFSEILKSVEDGTISTEEFETMFGSKSRKEGLMNTEDGEKYLEMFGKPKVSLLGASDAGVIMGKSPFKSRRYLQLQKLGLIDEVVLPSKRWLFDLGHDAEAFVGAVGARKLRRSGLDVRYEDAKYGAIDTQYPHVLIHPDGHIVDRKTGTLMMLAEVKTAAEMSSHWANDFSIDVVPEDYQCQVQVEMQVLSRNVKINKCCVLVWNKTGNEDGFKQLIIERDEKYAKQILREMEKFWKDTAKGKLYEEEDFLPSEIAEVYKDTDKELGYVEMPKKYEKILQQLGEISDLKASLREEIAPIKADLDELEKQEKLLKSRLYSGIGKAPGGTCRVGDDFYRVDVRRSFSLDADVKQMADETFSEMFPEEWKVIKETIMGFKPLVSARITKMSCINEDAPAEVIDID